jgi:hypothetical protein
MEGKTDGLSENKKATKPTYTKDPRWLRETISYFSYGFSLRCGSSIILSLIWTQVLALQLFWAPSLNMNLDIEMYVTVVELFSSV